MTSITCETCKLKFPLMQGERKRKYCTEECTPSSQHFVPEMNPDYTKGQSVGTQRERLLKYTYGIDNATYNIMLDAQAGVCAICWNPPKEGTMLVVDHCHETGEVRALLCRTCNVGLGMFYDDHERLLDAVQYLREHHKRLKR